MRHARRLVLGGGCVLLVGGAVATTSPIEAAGGGSYEVKELVANEPPARHVDPNLVNAWGIAFPRIGNVVVANAGTGTATRYDGNGVAGPEVISIPGPRGSDEQGEPTGVVFNTTGGFEIHDDWHDDDSFPARFLFAGEDGVISGWNPRVDADEAVIAVDNSASNAVYKGIAIANDGADDFLYATDFHNGRVDVWNGEFGRVTPVGGFRDANLPSGYAPFGIRNIGGALYVTFAKQVAGSDDEAHGPGLGLIDVFDANGILLRRLVPAGRALDAPWGLALAPSNFGKFSNNLLVGNFGNGTIAAYDITSGDFRGKLRDDCDEPIVIDGLWGISFGNGSSNQPKNVLFFAAGPDEEENGLYGRIQVK